jgi:hypothetical protein
MNKPTHKVSAPKGVQQMMYHGRCLTHENHPETVCMPGAKFEQQQPPGHEFAGTSPLKHHDLTC